LSTFSSSTCASSSLPPRSNIEASMRFTKGEAGSISCQILKAATALSISRCGTRSFLAAFFWVASRLAAWRSLPPSPLLSISVATLPLRASKRLRPGMGFSVVPVGPAACRFSCVCLECGFAMAIPSLLRAARWRVLGTDLALDCTAHGLGEVGRVENSHR